MKDHLTRDKAIQKLVAGKLRAQLKDRTADCADAATLAAYVERTLTPAERLTWESHFVTCSWCQEQVARLVRLGEAEEPAEVPEAAAARRRGGRILALRWAWAAPALLALVVAGLWYTGEFGPRLQPSLETAPGGSVPTPRPKPSAAAPADTREPAASPAPGVRDQLAKVQGPKREKPELSSSLSSAAPEPPASPASGKPRPGLAADAAVGAAHGEIATPSERANLAARGAERGRPGESRLETREDRFADRLEVPAPSPAAAPQTAREGAEVKESAAAAEAEKKQLGQPESGVPAKVLAARNLKSKKSAMAGLTARQGATSAFVPAAPKPATWRVGPRGLIQKTDGGGNWLTQVSGVETDLLDITFPSPSLGWAVGRAGTILRTTDGGITWNKIPIPTADDLVQVTALDGQVARVVTIGGQVLTTSDGGKSWRALPQN